MKVVYARQPYEIEGPVIFLAGPTPREKSVPSWRPEALRLLQEMGFAGTVFVPEDEGWGSMDNLEYGDQIAWERDGLRDSDVIVFWVPRDLKDMPGLTTNIEYGAVTGLGPTPAKPYVLGYPPGTRKMGYLEYVANEQQMPVRDTLEETLREAMAMAAIIAAQRTRI
jgi:hypothetical protein